MAGRVEIGTGGDPESGLIHWMVTRADRWLLVTSAAFLLCVPGSIVGALVDARTLDGVSVWFKPIKFQVSVAVFLITLALMMAFAGERFRRSIWGRGTVLVAITMGAFEIFWITFQAARGERSHYHTETTFGAVMYALMGIGAVLLSLTVVIVGIVAGLKKSKSSALRIIRWGVFVAGTASLVGSAGVGVLLGGRPDHFIGGDETDATGLAFLGWSTTGGDLRIAHFFGLHALQGIFVLAFLLSRAPVRIAQGTIALVGVGWVAGTLWLTGIAMSGTRPWPLGLIE